MTAELLDIQITKQMQSLKIQPRILTPNFLLSLTHNKNIQALKSAQDILVTNSTKNQKLAEQFPLLYALCKNLLQKHQIIAAETRNSCHGIEPQEEVLFEQSQAVIRKIESIQAFLAPIKNLQNAYTLET